jgi:hypothetical protein
MWDGLITGLKTLTASNKALEDWTAERRVFEQKYCIGTTATGIWI